MSIEANIQALLAPLAGGRCYPLIAPDSVDKPYIIYSVISDVQLNSLDGFSGLAEKRIQADIYTTSYGVTKALATSVKDTFAINLPSSIHLSSQELFESDTQLYRISMDFSIWS